MSQAGILQEPTEWLGANASLPYVLMPIQLRSSRSFRVIAVPHRNILQSNGCIKLSKCLGEAFFRCNVIARYVRVTCINARGCRNMVLQVIDDLGNLLEARAQ